VHLVLTRLHRPHGGRVGPDGKVYVGEVDGIFRFDPAAVNVAIDALPPAPPGPLPWSRWPARPWSAGSPRSCAAKTAFATTR
jgi:hypothetical protein